MEIRDIGGFCPGVIHAFNSVLKLQKRYKNKQLVMIGDLVHNSDVLERLKGKGIITVDSIDDLAQLNQKDIIPVIRAHGTTIQEEEKLRKIYGSKGYIDLTCTLVKNGPQKYAEELSNYGYKVVIFGKVNHPEVLGIVSHTNNGYIVYENPEAVSSNDFYEGEPVGVVAQTTSEIDKYWVLVDKLRSFGLNVEAMDTYCHATKKNQKGVKEIADWADLVIVIGGKKSSNTQRLAEICNRVVTTYKIETSNELNEDWFKEKPQKIGIAAGASTPPWIIGDVRKTIERDYK